MVAHAQQIGADAVIGMRYDATEFAQHASEVLAYGTAVKLAVVGTPASAEPATKPGDPMFIR
jgi:hypothetical protein